MELINFSNIIRGRLQSISWAEYLLMVAVLELAIKLIYDLYKKAKVIKVLNGIFHFVFVVLVIMLLLSLLSCGDHSKLNSNITLTIYLIVTFSVGFVLDFCPDLLSTHKSARKIITIIDILLLLVAEILLWIQAFVS